MRVLEIGCGVTPGPYFEGADVHYIIDCDPVALKCAAQQTGFTPLPEADGRATGLPDRSIDVVIAGNVFGDPDLGTSDRNTFDMLRYVLEPNNNADHITEILARKQAVVYERKRALIHEASRVLTQNGVLLALENLTPFVAAQFFQTLPNPTGGLGFAPAQPSDIPASYAKKYGGFAPDFSIWRGSRVS